MNWISPKEKLPPQGKKVLWFGNGEAFVVQRFGDYWIPIPFFDSKYAFNNEPELWCDIEMPNELTGKIFVSVENEKLVDIDTLEEIHKDVYERMIKTMLNMWR